MRRSLLPRPRTDSHARCGHCADVNDSRIIGPDGQGPEQQLAVASNKEELLVADIVPQAASGVKRQLARDGSRAIFKELAKEMAKAALEAEAEVKAAARL